jgi:hypothetical protein
MADFLTDLAAFGASALPTLTVRTAVMPETPDRVLVLRPYPGLASDKGFGSALLVFEHPRVQVVARGAREDFDQAWADGQAAYVAYGSISAQALSDTFYHNVRPLTPPFLLRYDENRRPEVVFNLHIDKDL